MNKNYIEVYTDGACSGNPGKGAWAAILLYKNHIKEIFKAYRKTTNNRMELMAVIEALESIKKKDIPVIVYSDSRYIVDSINKRYIDKWKNRNFKGTKNPDLWQKLVSLIEQFKHIKFEWVKGHHINEINKQCDAMAVSAYVEADKKQEFDIDEYYEKHVDNSSE